MDLRLNQTEPDGPVPGLRVTVVAVLAKRALPYSVLTTCDVHAATAPAPAPLHVPVYWWQL
jgi:hypothetical protein